jgi:hypothetical protein
MGIGIKNRDMSKGRIQVMESEMYVNESYCIMALNVISKLRARLESGLPCVFGFFQSTTEQKPEELQPIFRNKAWTWLFTALRMRLYMNMRARADTALH